MTDSLGELPPEVLLSIERILNIQNATQEESVDTLSSYFNPTSTLNKLFPDEASLSQMDTIQDRLSRDTAALQAEMDALHEELKAHQDPQKMQLIQEMIADLMSQMSRIREQATESEAVVRNITKDIQLLDLAKRNLINSMTFLKRLQMLANALSQLEEFVRDKKYADAAQSLSAVKELSAPFKPSLSIPRIALLWARLQTLQGELRTKIDHDFNAFYLPDPSNPIKPTQISNACIAVDVIGDDFRSLLIDRYCAIELKEYKRVFKTSDEAGQLDNLPRRFAFLKRVLQNHETERGRTFPSGWCVGQHLCAKFIDFTREDLHTLLGKAGKNLTITILMQSLQHCLEFEAFVTKKYSTSLIDLMKSCSTIILSENTLSSAFEPHMGVFIDAQNKALTDMLAPHRSKNQRVSIDIPSSTSAETSDAPSVVLPSSTELFYFYGQILDQCSKLFTGKPLLDLAHLQKKWLRIYADEVLLPSLRRQPTQTRRSTDTAFDITELKHACLLINTAEYCQITASELEERIIDKLDTEFKSNVSFQDERDLFIGVISFAILALLKSLESAVDMHFDVMMKTQWSSIVNVSGPSPYVAKLTSSIGQISDAVIPLIEQKKYLRNFHDKAAALIIAKFTNALVRSRPLKEVGAEQLLLDLQEVRTCLLKLPGTISTTTSYGKSITKNTVQLETLLKVIIPPSDPAEGFILNYTLLVGDASFSNFQKVLDLKGTPRPEQNDLLDSFVAIASTKPELEGTSFLSSLDMDPPAAHLGSGLASPAGSRVHLPSLIAGANNGGINAEGILSSLSSPPPSGPSTGSDNQQKSGEKREVFSDLRRLVTFGLRRETLPPQ